MQQREKMQITCLEEEKTLLCGKPLQYRMECLTGEQTLYSVSIRYGEEERSAILGMYLEFAYDCFRELVCGRVTPCTLPEIISDWEAEERIF